MLAAKNLSEVRLGILFTPPRAAACDEKRGTAGVISAAELKA